ncbi:MAG: hypothetical protein IT337_01990 [Thermomicrobiales bacterium]|nr:hypothetical protein [Thermomicrobiales bacterium]
MRGFRAIAAAGLLVGTGAFGFGWAPGGPGAGAQQAAPAQQRLVAIHAGTCEDPADRATFPLALVQPQLMEAGRAEQASDLRGSRTTDPLLVGNGVAATTLDALLDGEQPYVLLVHRNAQETSAGIACGEIGGPVIGEQVTLALRPLNDAGFAGVAVLGSQDEAVSGLIVLFDDVDAFSGAKPGKKNAGAASSPAKPGKAVRQAGGGGGQRASGGGQGGGGTTAEDRAAQKAARKAARQAERQAARAAQGGAVAPPADGVVGGVATQPPLEEPQETPPVAGTPVVEEPVEPPADETPTDETPTGEEPIGETPVDETPSGEEPTDETPTGEEPTDETPVDENLTPDAETPPAEAPLDEPAPVETPVVESEAPPAEIPASEAPVAEPNSETPPAEAVDQPQQIAPEETPAAEGFAEVGQTAEPEEQPQAVDPVDHWQAGEPVGQWRPAEGGAATPDEAPAA